MAEKTTGLNSSAPLTIPGESHNRPASPPERVCAKCDREIPLGENPWTFFGRCGDGFGDDPSQPAYVCADCYAALDFSPP